MCDSGLSMPTSQSLIPENAEMEPERPMEELRRMHKQKMGERRLEREKKNDVAKRNLKRKTSNRRPKKQGEGAKTKHLLELTSV